MLALLLLLLALLLLLLQVREVLEGYLDDDQDMKDMNITAKEQHALQQAVEAQVGLDARQAACMQAYCQQLHAHLYVGGALLVSCYAVYGVVW
jgi:hypothetical protein